MISKLDIPCENRPTFHKNSKTVLASFSTTQCNHRKGKASRKWMRDPWTNKCIPELRIPDTLPESSLFKPAPHNPWSHRTIPPPPNALDTPIHYGSDVRPGEEKSK